MTAFTLHKRTEYSSTHHNDDMKLKIQHYDSIEMSWYNIYDDSF